MIGSKAMAPKKEGGDVSLSSELSWQPGKPEDIRAFFETTLPEAHALLLLKHGIVAAEPTLGPEYVHRYSPFPVSTFREDILNQIRRTAAFSIILLEEWNREGDDLHKKLAKVVEAFEGDPHWENFAARGLSRHADGRFDEAISLYERAMKTIDNDPHFRAEADWEPIRSQLSFLKDLAESETHPWQGFATPPVGT
jgi:hypothetical protein